MKIGSAETKSSFCGQHCCPGGKMRKGLGVFGGLVTSSLGHVGTAIYLNFKNDITADQFGPIENIIQYCLFCRTKFPKKLIDEHLDSLPEQLKSAE
jgi:hypothetical protein